MYLVVKNIHILLIVFSVTLFSVRYVLLMMNSPLKENKYLKIAPHIVDTFLLLSGVALIHIVGFVPFHSGSEWLTEKVIYILVYVGLTFFTLRMTKNNVFRTFMFFGALGYILMISKIATTKASILLQVG